MNTIITQENYEAILESVRKQPIHERDTQTILHLFFFHEHWNKMRLDKHGRSFDSSRLYEYELSLGKKFFEMDADEILEFVLKNPRRDGKLISHYTYRWQHCIWLAVWRFYIENLENIRNPWIREEMLPAVVSKRLIDNKEKLTAEILEDIIAGGEYAFKDKEHYEYAELFIRLLYDGVPSLRDIMDIKEEQIDFKSGVINGEHRIVHISDRTAELLRKVHCFEPFTTYKQAFYPTPYNGSYIPLLVKKNYVDSVDERSMDAVTAIINKNVSKILDKKVAPRDVYQLGFFDFIGKNVGYTEAREIIMTPTQGNTMKLMALVGKYGYNVMAMENARRNLMAFL